MRKIAPPVAVDEAARTLAAALGRPFAEIDLLDRIGDVVFFIKDRDARYVAVNETLALRCKAAGKGALVGRRASEVFPPPLGERFEKQDLKVLREGLSIRGRLELHLYPDGSEGWCLTWKEPLVDADGAIQGLAGVSRDAPAPSRDLISEGLSNALAYIEDHLDAPLRIPDLAARAGLSVFKFDQRIRALFAVSAGQYLGRVRIDHACDRLRHTDAPLSELALECGYADQAAFTRQFRKSVGLTPGAYRVSSASRRRSAS